MKQSIVLLLLLSGLTAAAQQQNTPVTVALMPDSLSSTSSLFFWDGLLWSCNDHYGLTLYGLDTAMGAVVRSIATGVSITDMEEVAQDGQHLYFGDFGNNAYGNRHDLRILRLGKERLLGGDIRFDTIAFAYPGQTDGGTNATDYDCEAFVAAGDSLYLFSKQWLSQRTVCYALPKQPGTYEARAADTLNIEGLATGACYDSAARTLVLCGYSKLCQPFLYMLYGFEGRQFFGGHGAKMTLGCGMGTQVEGIASNDGRRYYLSNEAFSKYGIQVPSKLMYIDLGVWLDSAVADTEGGEVRLFPNPTARWLRCSGRGVEHITFTDLLGRVVLQHRGGGTIDLGSLAPGCYNARIESAGGVLRQTIVRQ